MDLIVTYLNTLVEYNRFEEEDEVPEDRLIVIFFANRAAQVPPEHDAIIEASKFVVSRRSARPQRNRYSFHSSSMKMYQRPPRLRNMEQSPTTNPSAPNPDDDDDATISVPLPWLEAARKFDRGSPNPFMI